MAVGQGEVIELFLASGGRAGRIACPPALRPAAGQFLLASRLADANAGSDHAPSLEVLPVPLFAALNWQREPRAGEFTAAPPLPPGWTVGARLSLRGPLGRGFHLVPAARRVALAAWGASPARLMPLAYLALNQGASVALCMPASGWEAGGEPLPLEIEILPLEGLADLLPWADYLAVDLPRESIPQLRRAMRLPADQRASIDVEVLLDTPTPCGGAAECGVCAVKTRRGWKLACKDGPVFDFNLLEEA